MGKQVRRLVDQALLLSPAAPSYSLLKQAAKPKKKNQNQNQVTGISVCLKKFISAQYRPFHEDALGSCIPSGSLASSARFFYRGTITVTVGSGGIGWLMFSPTCAANTAVAFYTNNSAYAGATTAVCSTAPAIYDGSTVTWSVANPPASPYIGIATVASGVAQSSLLLGLNANVDAAFCATRLVGGGLSVKYIGTELDRGGMIYGYQSPIHATSGSYNVSGSINAGLNESKMTGIPEAFSAPVTRDVTLFPFGPVSDQEMMYSNELTDSYQSYENTNILYNYSGGDSVWPSTDGVGYRVTESSNSHGTGVPVQTLMFTGKAGNQFLVEYGMHFEFTGPFTAGMAKRPADSDPVGVQRVQAASQRFNSTRKHLPGVEPYNEFKRHYTNVVSESMPKGW